MSRHTECRCVLLRARGAWITAGTGGAPANLGLNLGQALRFSTFPLAGSAAVKVARTAQYRGRRDPTHPTPSQTSCPQIKHPVWPTESLRRHRQSDAPFPHVCGLPVSTGAKPSGPAARAETQCGFAISELGPLRTRSAAERARLERDREVRGGERKTVEGGVREKDRERESRVRERA